MKRGSATVIGWSRYPDGNVLEGPYEAGKEQGHWVLRLPDGGVQEGPYEAGKRHGRWVERDADGYVQEGPYEESLRQGWWVMRKKGLVVDMAYFTDGEGQWTLGRTPR